MMKRLLSISIIIIYSLLLFKVMVLKDVPLIRIGDLMLNFGGTQHGASNLIPFKTIIAYFDGHKGFLIACINLLGNVLLLVPIGFLFPLAFLIYDWRKIILVSVCSGTGIELLQLALKVGIFDIDDVLLNSLGVGIGYSFLLIYKKASLYIGIKHRIIALVIFASLIPILFGVYYWHFGISPISIGHVSKNGLIIDDKNQEISTLSGDPCNGTGGIGLIMKFETNVFIIRRNDGIEQAFQFLENTTIKSASGVLTKSALKIGDRVTIITGPDNGNHLTAALILVCGQPNPIQTK